MSARLRDDFERFKRGLPANIAEYIREAYGIDLTARYLGRTIPHPIGKGSGQLSLNLEQLETDRAAGLAFVVLKTVIGENASGERTMGAWALHETRMKVERRASVRGVEGWTVTWKGRGWDRSFDDYLALVRGASDLTAAGAMLAVPSVKLHLPLVDEPFQEDEYRHTIGGLAASWSAGPLPIEKDFSPTLAGDPLADERAGILRWLRDIPARIREAAGAPVGLALKLMNARFDDAFQLEMLEAARGADTLVCFNRLWDPLGGVAYGGYDLSDRNLRVLANHRGSPTSLAGTGNVCSGRMVAEYARLGCESVQLHTFFQLPLHAYAATVGSRTQRALHALLFDPADGLIACMRELEEAGTIERRDRELHFLDLAAARTRQAPR
jgi:hypothetical protein